MLDGLQRDIRHAVRSLRRSPMFTVVAVLSLALGIGANTAIFTVVDALMWRELPVPNPGRLVTTATASSAFVTYAEYEQLRDASPDVVLSAIVHTDRYNVGVGGPGRATTVDEGPVRLALISGNYFAAVGVGARVGRVLGIDDDREASAPVAVVSDSYWRSRFAGSDDPAGRALTFSGVVYTIVGVVSERFTGEWVGRPTDVWIPIVAQPRVMTEIPLGLPLAAVTTIGRLRNGAADSRVEAAMQVAYVRFLRDRAGNNPTARQRSDLDAARIHVRRAPHGYSPQRESFGPSLTILMIAVGALLLIACANIANLMLARADARRRELSVRAALGASRLQLGRQLLTESAIVSVAAAAVGLACSYAATAALETFLAADPAGRGGVGIALTLVPATDARSLLFTAALAVTTTIFFGVLPAIRGASVLASGLLGSRGEIGSSQRGWFRPRSLLVIAQVACSVVLLIAAGLFARTLRALSTEDLGFSRDHILLVWALPGQTEGRGAGAADFWRRVTDRLSAVPGVTSATASNQGVLNGAEAGGGSGPALRVEGDSTAQAGIPSWRSFVTPAFFRTMGIPLLAGREFTERDTAAAPRGVVVNQTFARHYFGDQNPVGRRLWFPEDSGAPTEIIGLVKDSAGGTPRDAVRHPGLTYFSYRDKEAARRLRTMTVAVSTSAEPSLVAPQIRQALRELDANLPVVKIDTVDEQLADVLVQERLMATLSTFFGAAALLLACLGLYGVVSYSVGRRTSEMGVRMALGASRQAILTMVLGESLWLVTAGVAVGIPIALAGSRLIAARLFGVSATDPATIALATLTMAAVASGAALIPARRAAHVDPLVALRQD